MRRISKTFVTLLFMAMPALGTYAQVAEIEEGPKIWSLEECLQYGLKNHPKVIMADSDVKSAEASLLAQKAKHDATLVGNVSWDGNKTRGTNIGDSHYSGSRSESLSLKKTFFESGAYFIDIKSAREALKAAKMDRETALISLAANIKTMFFKAQQAQSLLQVKLDTLEGYEKHLKKVESFVEVGTHAPYDITKAQVDVANARVDLINAKNSLKQALVNVGNAIGIGEPVHVTSYEMHTLPDIDESVKLELVKVALERPEVKAAESNVKSANFGIQKAKLALKPTVSASAGYSWAKPDYSNENRGWNVEAGVSWTLFNGRNTKASVNKARSSYERSKASFDNLKLNIGKEVENGINDIIGAAQRVKAYEYVVRQASESLELAEGRYDAGLGSPLEVTDARVDFEKAKGNFITAYFDCLIAQTNLDITLGRMPSECDVKNTVEESVEAVTNEVLPENNETGKLDIEFEAEK